MSLDVDFTAIRERIAALRREGRAAATELEALDVARAAGIAVPRHALVDGPADVAPALELLGGPRVVLKAVSAHLAHKTELGAVAIVPSRANEVEAAVSAMRGRLAGVDDLRFALVEYVDHDTGPGGELLIGLRSTPDFGPVVTLAPGGVHAEALAAAGFLPAILTPRLTGAHRVGAALERSPLAELITRPRRGCPPRIEARLLHEIVARFVELARELGGDELAEFEINPLALTDRGVVALDALLRLADPVEPLTAPRPLDKIDRLLRPRSVAVIGVSRRLNPGHIIVRNLLRAGFWRESIHVIKPGLDRFEGCPCHESLEALPAPVDLCVLAVDSAQVPPLMRRIVDGRLAECAIVIPGGLGERSGSESLAGELRAVIDASRLTDWRGPLVNGGNCLGLRSRPGRFDTLFIPEEKFPPAGGRPAPLALISQSGAFMLAMSSKLDRLDPRYLVSIGNQIDLTVGDYLTALAGDPETKVFACYVEGFRPGDGERWLAAADAVTRSGRTVVLYRAGRTAAGARATASHTASIAGDYSVSRELAAQAGVLVADTLEDFEELSRLACLLAGRRPDGVRLGAVSNAGFECVAIADRSTGFELAVLSESTRARVATVLERCHLDAIVGVANPLDVTPIADDEAFAEAAAALLDDPGVDVGVVGCVPHTSALATLPVAEIDGAPVFDRGSVVRRLAQLRRRTSKPWVAIVDAGRLYDPMARELDAVGIPVFRNADRAMRLFAAWCEVSRPVPASPTPAAS